MIEEVNWDWNKYGKYLAPAGRSLCPICNESIRQGESGITYSRTRGNTHLFLHIKCVKGMEVGNGRKETDR